MWIEVDTNAAKTSPNVSTRLPLQASHTLNMTKMLLLKIMLLSDIITHATEQTISAR